MLRLIAIGLFIASTILVAQDPASFRAPLLSLRGVVTVDDEAAAPVRRVRVEISASGLSGDPVFTDDLGRFVVSIPNGPYTITFTKPGFARQEMRQSSAAVSAPLAVRLPRGAVITGRVLDEFGDPMIARVRVRSGTREAVVESDPLGEFRAGSLPAGRYEIAVLAGLGSLAEPDAQQVPTSVDLRAGDEAAVSLRSAVVGQAMRMREAAGLAMRRATQPARQGETAVVRGRVSRTNGLPVGGTFVTLQRQGQPDRSTVTDEDGRYTFDALPAGTAALYAGKIGPSLTSTVREVRVVLADGQSVDDVNLTLDRNPTVEGVVTDEHREPVEGLTVELWQRRSGGGRAVLVPLGQLATRARTDDRGHYRLLAPPGTWYVVATEQRSPLAGPHPGAADLALRVFYPGSAAPGDAMPLRIERGRDVAGIDITFAPRAGGRIQGVALDASGRPLSAPVMLMDSYRSGVPTPSPRSAAIAADGRFVFDDVPAGDYVLHGIVQGPGGRAAEFAMTYVTVSDGDAAPVVLRTSPGTTLTGQVVLESSQDTTDVRTFGLSAQTADWDYISVGRDASRAVIHEDGTFELTGLYGPLRVTASPPPGWWLKSVNIGAVDVAEQPFVFGGGTPRIDNVAAVFSDTAAEIRGRVVDREERRSGVPGDRNPPVLDYSVLVFSTDRYRWWAPSGYVRLARPDSQGQFRALALPPGDYFAVAVDRFDITTEWLDPEILAELAPAADRVTVRAHDQLTIELDLIRRPQ